MISAEDLASQLLSLVPLTLAPARTLAPLLEPLHLALPPCTPPAGAVL